MRARLALWSSGQTCELREVVLARKPKELLEVSSKATVPVLIEANGHVIDQSMDIMLWALNQHDPHQWLKGGGEVLVRMLHLIAQTDGEFKFHLDRYKYPNRYDLPDGQVHRQQGAVFLAQLDTQLQQHAYLMDDAPSLADMAMAPFVRQFAHTDPTWFAEQPWRALQSWLTTFESSAAYEQVMNKYTPWTPGTLPVLFPAVAPC